MTIASGALLMIGKLSRCRPLAVVLTAAAMHLAAADATGAAADETGTRELLGLERIRVWDRDYYRPTRDFGLADYDGALFLHHVSAIPLETVGVFGATAVIGVVNWDWGNSGFHVQNEGWFGRNTGSGGMDKLGHAFTGALLADLFTDRIRMTADRPEGAAVTGALLSLGVMTMVEVFDGFATDHGFSYEDMLSDSVGIAFSLLRNTVPGLREKLDFRQEYVPRSYMGGFHPILGYEGKRFLLALKLSGFDTFRDTPLRYLEIHAGYYARGFSRAAREAGVPKIREPYVGIGINLNELFFGRAHANEGVLKWGARFTLEHFQPPYTSFGSGNRYYKSY